MKRCRRRTARRCGWPCPGSTASKNIKSIVKVTFVEKQPAYHMESGVGGRLWLLCQCESGGRSSHAQPGDGNSARQQRVRPENQDAEVQRIRRSGQPLRGDGSSQELLTRLKLRVPCDRHEEILVERMDARRAVFVVRGFPFLYLLWRGYENKLTAEPDRIHHSLHGRLDSSIPADHTCHYASARDIRSASTHTFSQDVRDGCLRSSMDACT